MGKRTKNLLNRTQYERIKKMDHHSMNIWAGAFYAQAYEDGKRSVPESFQITEEFLRDALGAVKGIGVKRTEEAVTKIMLLVRNEEGIRDATR